MPTTRIMLGVLLLATPAMAQTALQQFLANETGYMPQATAPAPAPAAVPAPAPVPPVAVAAAPPVRYVPAQPAYAAPVQAADSGYYRDPGSSVGPSSESPGLRALMTSSGF